MLYRAGWSVDHAATATHLEMLMNVTGNQDRCHGNMMLGYGEDSSKVTTLSLVGDYDHTTKTANAKVSIIIKVIRNLHIIILKLQY